MLQYESDVRSDGVLLVHSSEPDLARITVQEALAEMARVPGIHVYGSAANFILFRVTSGAITHTELFRRLLDEHGILVRDVSKYPMLDRCLRVNAGTEEETTAFLDALGSIMGEVEGAPSSPGTAQGE